MLLWASIAVVKLDVRPVGRRAANHVDAPATGGADEILAAVVRRFYGRTTSSRRTPGEPHGPDERQGMLDPRHAVLLYRHVEVVGVPCHAAAGIDSGVVEVA